MKKKPLEIDMIAGSQLRDTQGEMLSVEGADISDLQNGNGRLNDNHGKGFFNSIGRITSAKKIFKAEDCADDRQKYYWEKVKAPFVYCRGYLYDDQDHPNARAAAAILRNAHNSDAPLKIKASVEGGVISRGVKDESLLARTKIHSVALTFTPANTATLVEPISLNKAEYDREADLELIKSVIHLAQTNVPSFRHITRHASAGKILNNLEQIQKMADQLGISEAELPLPTKEEILNRAVEIKIAENTKKINELTKALTAGYGGAAAPTSRVGGAVIQSEYLSPPKEFKFITCDDCGKEQIHAQYQVKCRSCNKGFPLDKLYKFLASSVVKV
jgi:hypothetical protein